MKCNLKKEGGGKEAAAADDTALKGFQNHSPYDIRTPLHTGAEELPQLVKSLPCTHEELSLVLITQWETKHGVRACISARGAETGGFSGGVSGSSREKPCLKIQVESGREDSQC